LSPRLVLQNDISRYKLVFSLISERLWRKMLAQSGEDLQRMNDTRKIPEAGEQDVNEEVAVATTFKEDADGW
jgi:hypothetical protein